MAKILLGVTGSVAAIRTPLLFQNLTSAGHHVKIVSTEAAAYFFDAKALPPGVLFQDADEWPGRESGKRWQREEPVLHIELRRWADLLLVAPLDANTLAKLAAGLCDNCLTCVYRAWDPTRPVVLAPAMNTLMWQHPLTLRHVRQLAEIYVADNVPPPSVAEELLEWIGEHTAGRLRFVGPITKQLACGDTGVGAMAEVPDIVAAVAASLQLSGGLA